MYSGELRHDVIQKLLFREMQWMYRDEIAELLLSWYRLHGITFLKTVVNFTVRT